MIKKVLAGLAVLTALGMCSQAEASSLSHVLGIIGKGKAPQVTSHVNGKPFNLGNLWSFAGHGKSSGSSYQGGGSNGGGSCGKPTYSQCSAPVSSPCSVPRGNSIPASNCGSGYTITINITINITIKGKFGGGSCSSCVCYGFA